MAAGAPRTTRKKKNNNMLKVIFDTDPGVDDALALLYLHKHPQIDLIGVTTTFGNASVESTTHNALYLKQTWGFAAPVARGAAGPLQPEATPEAWPVHIHGHNGLGNHPVPAQLDVAADARPAAQLIIDLVRAHPGEVTLVAVGRMTNLALALQQAPDIAGLVRGVVLMGGAFHVNGNITPAAEANIWGDAEAADVVFTTDWPVTAIGLDVTTRVEMDRDGLDTLAGIGGADAELVRALSQDYVDFYLQAGHKGMVVHDCCACIALTRPELFQFERASVRVATDGVARGMTIPKPEGMGFGPSVWDGHVLQSVAIGVDAAAVLADIEQTLKV
ncbi:inosine-uridine preferring nucleoside hydrolase protein [Stenotrophomonas sp. SKA14]|nr:inosine-uridine preferring nucleoside hydrolase protein [Stenotrophomonas sp. SKA14]